MKRPLLRRVCPCIGIPFIRLLEYASWMFIAIALLGFPSHLVAKSPGTWNALTQVLFQVVTAFLSIVIGYRLSKTSSEQQATRKWLPPAQTACNQIQVMHAQVHRLRKAGRTTCDELQDLIKGLDETQRRPIEKVVRIKCETCKARLLDLEEHLQNAYETWRIFIRENCDRIVECDMIEGALAKFAESLRREDDLGT